MILDKRVTVMESSVTPAISMTLAFTVNLPVSYWLPS